MAVKFDPDAQARRQARLVAYRELRSLTQVQVAESADLEQSYVAKVEIGRVCSPNYSRLRALAKGYRLPLDQFCLLLDGSLTAESAANLAAALATPQPAASA
jgi:transcriptional regulator with XRE-family HTH domain